MRREAIDLESIGKEICELLGLVKGGWAGALGGGACDVVVNSIGGVVNNNGTNKQDNNTSIPQTFLQYQTLANTLKALGCQSPIYTDPKQLMQFFISGQGGKIGANGFQDQIKFVNAITSFVTAGDVIKTKYPTFVDDAVKYSFDDYVRHGYSLGQTINDLSQLSEKAKDPKQSFYVISVLRGNYEAAFLFNMLASYGNVDEKTYNNFSELSQMAVRMLGKQSLDILNVNALMDQKAMMNAKLFADRVEIFKFMVPIQESLLQTEQSVVDACYPIAKKLLHNPLVEKFLPYILLLPQVNGAAKYITGGAGEALNGGLS